MLYDISFINLYPYFKQSSLRPLFYDIDGHFTANGHRVAAEGIIAGIAYE